MGRINMTDSSLKSKAINIKGKEYVQVKDRVIYFNENYPAGKIETILVSDDKKVVIKAIVTPDCKQPERYFTGYSASNPAKTIEAQVPHEVAETSAVGRALAMMGIGVIDSISSVDELNKVGAVSQPVALKSAVKPICQYHKVEMFQTPKMKAPAHRDEVLGWCNGSGYQSEKEAWRNKLKGQDDGLDQLAQDVANEFESSL